MIQSWSSCSSLVSFFCEYRLHTKRQIYCHSICEFSIFAAGGRIIIENIWIGPSPTCIFFIPLEIVLLHSIQDANVYLGKYLQTVFVLICLFILRSGQRSKKNIWVTRRLRHASRKQVLRFWMQESNCTIKTAATTRLRSTVQIVLSAVVMVPSTYKKHNWFGDWIIFGFLLSSASIEALPENL